MHVRKAELRKARRGLMARLLVIYEVAADLGPGEAVTVETEHDGEAIDLRLIEAPPVPRSKWHALLDGWRIGCARRPAAPPARRTPRREWSPWPWLVALWLFR